MDLKRGAVLSDCKSYRYRLSRIWDEEKAKAMFVMLNPSTADAKKDDPTIRRCVGFAKEWGYGGIYVGNLYAYRTTNRKALNQVEDPVGPDNKFHVRKMAKLCEKIICAWGFSQGPPPDWLRDVGNLFYLDQNKDGTPSHPLYLAKETTPTAYSF
jgi:hypothetical protein